MHTASIPPQKHTLAMSTYAFTMQGDNHVYHVPYETLDSTSDEVFGYDSRVAFSKMWFSDALFQHKTFTLPRADNIHAAIVLAMRNHASSETTRFGEAVRIMEVYARHFGPIRIMLGTRDVFESAGTPVREWEVTIGPVNARDLYAEVTDADGRKCVWCDCDEVACRLEIMFRTDSWPHPKWPSIERDVCRNIEMLAGPVLPSESGVQRSLAQLVQVAFTHGATHPRYHEVARTIPDGWDAMPDCNFRKRVLASRTCDPHALVCSPQKRQLRVRAVA